VLASIKSAACPVSAKDAVGRDLNVEHSESFSSLNPEKQNSIRQACIKEFARAGYSSASTNTMCKEAGISKGLLFYYFGSKQRLYLYLTDYCTKLLHDAFYTGLEYPAEDIVTRLLNWTLRKWSLAEQNPLHYAFLVQQQLDCPKDVQQTVDMIRGIAKEKAYQAFSRNLDLSSLRPGVSKEAAMDFVLVAVEGLRARNIEKYRQNPQPLLELHAEIMRELKDFCELCRFGIIRCP